MLVEHFILYLRAKKKSISLELYFIIEGVLCELFVVCTRSRLPTGLNSHYYSTDGTTCEFKGKRFSRFTG